MKKILYILVVLSLISFHLAIADDIADQSSSDIYYEMNSKLEDLPDNSTEENSNEQIRNTGDKYGLTYQESRDLFQEGNALELEDE